MRRPTIESSTSAWHTEAPSETTVRHSEPPSTQDGGRKRGREKTGRVGW